MRSWHVLRVKPRHEKVTGEALRLSGFEPFVPTSTELRQWSDRKKAVEVQLFPGYVFCRFHHDHQLQVLKIPGVVSIVSFSKIPAAVPDEEIDAIRTIVASGLPARPGQYLRTGDMVTVEEGCLAGVSGILLREKTSVRVVVNITLLQRSVAVELDRTMVSACPGARQDGTAVTQDRSRSNEQRSIPSDMIAWRTSGSHSVSNSRRRSPPYVVSRSTPSAG